MLVDVHVRPFQVSAAAQNLILFLAVHKTYDDWCRSVRDVRSERVDVGYVFWFDVDSFCCHEL